MLNGHGRFLEQLQRRQKQSTNYPKSHPNRGKFQKIRNIIHNISSIKK
jgi:hypothetical protein